MSKKQKKKITKDIKFFLLKTIGVPVFSLLIWILVKTWRFELKNSAEFEKITQDKKNGLIAAFWHSDMIGILGSAIFLRSKGPYIILISPSRDGEVLSKIVNKFGVLTQRGSSSKNPVASIIALKSSLIDNNIVALAVDGPRGPRHEAKAGVILLSKHARSRVVPVTINSNKKIVFKSWDKTELPLPFAKVIITFGTSFLVDAEADKDDIEKNRKNLEEILLEIKV